MNTAVINYYKAHEENTAMVACWKGRELKKAYPTMINLDSTYVFAATQPEMIDGGRFHYVTCWKKNEDNTYTLICRSNHRLNTLDLDAQLTWMKGIARQDAQQHANA